MDLVFWYVSIIVLLIVGIFFLFLLYVKSSQPEEWVHKSVTDDRFYTSGSLTDLVDSLKTMPVDYSGNSPLKMTIEKMFFDKIRTLYGFSYEELVEFKNIYPDKLRALINDDEISSWIFNENNMGKKERYLAELNHIVDKMEQWKK